MTRMLRLLVPSLILLSLTTLSHAGEINARQNLSPAAQLKVNRTLAKSYAFQSSSGTQKAPATAQPNGCGTTQLGTLPTSPIGSAPIDNVTVIRGDVITINRNVQCQ